MRKILLAGTAIAVVMAANSAGAADLSRPVYKAPPPPIPVFSWTGWYVGVHVGGAWARRSGRIRSFPDLMAGSPSSPRSPISRSTTTA